MPRKLNGHPLGQQWNRGGTTNARQHAASRALAVQFRAGTFYKCGCLECRELRPTLPPRTLAERIARANREHKARHKAQGLKPIEEGQYE